MYTCNSSPSCLYEDLSYSPSRVSGLHFDTHLEITLAIAFSSAFQFSAILYIYLNFLNASNLSSTMIPVSIPSHYLIQIYCSIPWVENSKYLRLTSVGRGPGDGDEGKGMGEFISGLILCGFKSCFCYQFQMSLTPESVSAFPKVDTVLKIPIAQNDCENYVEE